VGHGAVGHVRPRIVCLNALYGYPILFVAETNAEEREDVVAVAGNAADVGTDAADGCGYRSGGTAQRRFMPAPAAGSQFRLYLSQRRIADPDHPALVPTSRVPPVAAVLLRSPESVRHWRDVHPSNGRVSADGPAAAVDVDLRRSVGRCRADPGFQDGPETIPEEETARVNLHRIGSLVQWSYRRMLDRSCHCAHR